VRGHEADAEGGDRREAKAPDRLYEALASSQRLGMLGGRPIPEVVTHAEAFVVALDGAHGVVIDLGSGGGVPGLVIADRRPDLELVLVDRRATRTDHLQRLVGRLGWSTRVRVVTAEAARLADFLDGPVDVVVARGFGSPRATLRAAAPLLRPGGRLVVSEPPVAGLSDVGDRWPADLSTFSLERASSPDRRVAVFTRAG